MASKKQLPTEPSDIPVKYAIAEVRRVAGKTTAKEYLLVEQQGTETQWFYRSSLESRIVLQPEHISRIGANMLRRIPSTSLYFRRIMGQLGFFPESSSLKEVRIIRSFLY